jgi:DNA-binding response OmpR family regulator
MRRRTVLVVEDDEDLRTLFRVTLALDRFTVLEARGAYDALRTIDSHSPDVIVLDLSLPDIDGCTVIYEVATRAVKNRIPIVVVTDSGDDLDHLEIACVLRKPVRPEQLIKILRECLEKSTRDS